MNYIECRPGVNVRKKDCVIIEAVDEMTCKISTPVGVVDCIYPSWRKLMQLEQPDINEQTVAPQPPVDRVNLWGNQYFAG